LPPRLHAAVVGSFFACRRCIVLAHPCPLRQAPPVRAAVRAAGRGRAARRVATQPPRRGGGTIATRLAPYNVVPTEAGTVDECTSCKWRANLLQWPCDSCTALVAYTVNACKSGCGRCGDELLLCPHCVRQPQECRACEDDWSDDD